jgi:prephenate dehydrogenase
VDSVAIFGVGLIGGSFGLALRKAGFSGTIVGVSSRSAIEGAITAGAIDRGVSLEEGVRCDLVFLAQPVLRIISTLGQLATLVRPGAIVTDAGSTKRAIVEAATSLPSFVGGHPMAGKETRGIESADADLFRGRPWLLTSEPPATLRRWIEAVGAQIHVLSPSEHDQLVALISHAPQLLSNAIARVTEPHRAFGGPGLRSMTRLADSSYEIWRDILETNRDSIVRALDEVLASATFLRNALDTQDDPAVASFFPKH